MLAEPGSEIQAMNAKKMLLSLVPWLLFSFMIHRRGEQAAGIAALAAAALAVLFIARAVKTGVKIIDVTGVVTFGAMGLASLTAGSEVTRWVADYGRGTSALVLAAVMITSAATVPFTEQYARESVPRQLWASPAFRAVNRRISLLWGAVMLVMGGGHLLAGYLDPMSAPVSGVRPLDLLLNWALPVVLILTAVVCTRRLAGHSTSDPAAQHIGADRAGAAPTGVTR